MSMVVVVNGIVYVDVLIVVFLVYKYNVLILLMELFKLIMLMKNRIS